uniref:Putative secreted protein n=1 Tax=Anopheles marajoara TaxID=58244 RepID=A0A2M4CEJ0_9DIPT
MQLCNCFLFFFHLSRLTWTTPPPRRIHILVPYSQTQTHARGEAGWNLRDPVTLLVMLPLMPLVLLHYSI